MDRYLSVRARHAQAYRAQLWLGLNNRSTLTASGVYQVIARRGQQAGVAVYPHRLRRYFSHTSLDRGGAEGDLMELHGPQRQCAPHLRPHHGPGTVTPSEPCAWSLHQPALRE